MSTIHYQKSGQVASLTISSPPANALSRSILEKLEAILDEVEQEQDIKALILKGEGKFFSAGADIKEFTSLQQAEDYTALAKQGQELFNRMEGFKIPIIAAIHGAALGGGLELAMACHIRLVSEQAKLGLPELTIGIIPGFAGTQRLPAYVGAAKAYEMILTGEPISGRTAAEYGLANHSYPEEVLFEKADELAAKVAAKSGPTIHRVMRLIPYTKNKNFHKGIEAEAEAFGEIFGNEDASEGITAFIEKRKPSFQDK
ncbi:enoyl-CoA hydratase [Sediminibacillus halophilus]|uniref:Enoyl-CoA hydratase n=1 Tax=Sediminibacillus halophilus TaxID=482461 RepID=A0A1G9XL29_9BACI|nr:enoyl-CoA hydratase [Sediminibacillus halophilus]SDM96953.1 enoyl-CoA hydratase [Sediminibacillus halophilus]